MFPLVRTGSDIELSSFQNAHHLLLSTATFAEWRTGGVTLLLVFLKIQNPSL